MNIRGYLMDIRGYLTDIRGYLMDICAKMIFTYIVFPIAVCNPSINDLLVRLGEGDPAGGGGSLRDCPTGRKSLPGRVRQDHPRGC